MLPPLRSDDLTGGLANQHHEREFDDNSSMTKTEQRARNVDPSWR